jgi:hypothetical protein
LAVEILLLEFNRLESLIGGVKFDTSDNLLNQIHFGTSDLEQSGRTEHTVLLKVEAVEIFLGVGDLTIFLVLPTR